MDVKMEMRQSATGVEWQELSEGLPSLLMESNILKVPYMGFRITVDGVEVLSLDHAKLAMLTADGYTKLNLFLEALAHPVHVMSNGNRTIRVLGEPDDVRGVKAATRCGAVVQRRLRELEASTAEARANRANVPLGEPLYSATDAISLALLKAIVAECEGDE